MPTFFVDLPGGPVVKNPFANAWDMGSTPGLEGPTCFRVTKPMHHNSWNLCTQSLCTTTGEYTTKRNYSKKQPPCLSTREGLHAAKKTSTTINKLIYFFNSNILKDKKKKKDKGFSNLTESKAIWQQKLSVNLDWILVQGGNNGISGNLNRDSR